jgi:hypothetical protein
MSVLLSCAVCRLGLSRSVLSVNYPFIRRLLSCPIVFIFVCPDHLSCAVCRLGPVSVCPVRNLSFHPSSFVLSNCLYLCLWLLSCVLGFLSFVLCPSSCVYLRVLSLAWFCSCLLFWPCPLSYLACPLQTRQDRPDKTRLLLYLS